MGPVYYLAIDIGASSGRHILGYRSEDGTLRLEEVYRFPNGLTEKNGHKCWDTDALFSHIVAGMKKCKEIGKMPSFTAIDTWGVDFVLLGKDGRKIGEAVGYRDGRTAGMDEEVAKIIPTSELYARTGIQKQIFNTVYQLTALKKYAPEQLDAADSLLMIPDYFGYLLTGVKSQEYTEATTGQLIHIETGDWDKDLIRRLGFPEKLFGPLAHPGERVGKLRPEIAEEIGYNTTVLHAPSHDTASAVLAVPTVKDDVAYLSSGTWSLMGIESPVAIAGEDARARNFTNEGGYAMQYRFLKNIMGLWMIQSVKKECGGKYSFDDLCEMAKENAGTSYRIDVNDASFLAPDSMIGAVRAYCRAPEMTLGEVCAVIYQSLTECYAETIREIEEVTGKRPSALHIIGGGSKDWYLNELTAKKTGLPVFAGPTEATAIGNLLCGMIATGVFRDRDEARLCVARSFAVKAV